jgi:imidazole glycerol phosphate synthase subunit HisF
VFIPLTVGGGVASVDDVDRLLRAGADKVAVNTAAIRRPELVAEIADRFGSQVLVLSVDARRTAGSDSGFERSHTCPPGISRLSTSDMRACGASRTSSFTSADPIAPAAPVTRT